MDIKQVTPSFWVAPQIAPDEVEALADLGVRLIVNDRPDGEAPEQPPSAAIARAARNHGLNYRHIPVKPSEIGEEDIAAFAAALAGADGPVLAFCRTGTRAVTLWALSNANSAPADTLIEAAAAAGYDIAALRSRLEARRLGKDRA